MTLQFEPVAALASLWLVLENPEPFDVSVFFIANAANHAIRVHCVDDIRILLGSLPAFASLQEEGILKRQKLCKFFVKIWKMQRVYKPNPKVTLLRRNK